MYTIHDNSTWNLHIPRSLTYRLASKAWWQSRRREASFVHRDPVKGGHTENTVQEKSVASPFDVTTYLPVDRPTHPYKQGLLERNRNNLYPKGLGRAIACRSVTTYRPYASCMHTHVFVAALSRDPGIFVPREHEVYGVCVVCVCVCVYLLRSAFEESIDRSSARHDRCLLSLFLFAVHRICEFHS